MPKRPPPITATDLESLKLQVNEALREISDYQEQQAGIDNGQPVFYNHVDFNQKQAKNVATPTSPQDAVNLQTLGPYVTGPSTTTDSEVAVFDGTAGNKIKGSTVTGIGKLAGGVLSAAVKGDADLILADQSGKDDDVLLTNGTNSRWGELPGISGTKRGAAPATGTPSGKFLRDDDTWTAIDGVPPSTGHPTTDVLTVAGWSPTPSTPSNKWWPGLNWWPHTVGRRWFP